MRVIIHVARLLREGIAYSVSTRRASVAIVLVVGLLLLALSLTAQTVAPVALYPFA